MNKLVCSVLALCLSAAATACAQHITVSGSSFTVGGNVIYLNGTNTPWHAWNDFGGGAYDAAWWNAEFGRIRAAGGNCARVWVTCNGETGVTIAADGTVTGTTAQFWSDLDSLFSIAQNNHVYVLATLMSFDHVDNYHPNYLSWRNMFASAATVQSFVDNYAVPFVNRYKSNPYLFGIDIINEPEWINQNASDGNLPWNELQYFVAKVADAIHANSSVPVTVGSAAVKWNSPTALGNYWSDAALQAQYNTPGARLDFYAPHYYGWVVQWYGDPALNTSPTALQIGDRPCIIGENPATGVYNNRTLEVAPSQMYLGALQNGWQGLLAWTSNGVDSYGSLSDCGVGLTNFASAYPYLVAATAPATPLYVDSTGAAISYSGRWSTVQNAADYGGSVSQTSSAGSALFAFLGTSIELRGMKGPKYNTAANVYIDGQLRQTANFYGSSTTYNQTIFSISGLTPGVHVVKVESTAKSAYIDVDAFIVN